MGVNENNIRARVVHAARLRCAAVAVENYAAPGTPDILTTVGLIEVKHIACWPKNANGIVRVPHFTKIQRTFHHRWKNAGGHSLILLVVGRGQSAEWVFLPGAWAANCLGEMPRAGLVAAGLTALNPGDETICSILEELHRKHA